MFCLELDYLPGHPHGKLSIANGSYRILQVIFFRWDKIYLSIKSKFSLFPHPFGDGREFAGTGGDFFRKQFFVLDNERPHIVPFRRLDPNFSQDGLKGEFYNLLRFADYIGKRLIVLQDSENLKPL